MTTPLTTTATPAPTIPLTPAEINSLSRWYRSKASPIRTYSARLRNRTTGDAYRPLETSATLPTASWQISSLAGSYKYGHTVTLGTNAPETMPARAQMLKSRRLAAMRALIRHEAAHAAHTQRDFATALVPLLRRANVPFAIFNLMEDARIEALMTAATGTPFDWRTHMIAPPATTDNPSVFFYSLVYHESALSGSRWTGTSPANAAWIREHYTRTIDPSQTPNSAAALIRAFEFAQRFALSAIELPPHRNPAAPDGTADPTHIPAPAPDAATTLGSASTATPTTPPAPADGPRTAAPHSAGGTPADITTELVRDLPAVFLQFARRPAGRPAEMGDSKRTAAELAAMARRAAVSPSRLGTSGSRLHAPAIATGAEQAFRRPAPDKGPRRLCLIVDMSGSMRQTYEDHAAAFIAAALELNRSKTLAVDIWLSQTGAAAKLPAATRPEALQLLGAYGSGEGLSNTMRLAAADMAAASAVVVYTDGELGSDRLPRRANGADIIGAACTEPDNAAHIQITLKKHFDRALVASTPHQLAREIVRYVLTRPN
jgi:hypothetical protein